MYSCIYLPVRNLTVKAKKIDKKLLHTHPLTNTPSTHTLRPTHPQTLTHTPSNTLTHTHRDTGVYIYIYIIYIYIYIKYL